MTEAELDQGFNYAEIADRTLVVDTALYGICEGLSVAQHSTPDLTIDIALGTAHDKNGQRCRVPANANLDCAIDENSVSTAVLTAGNEKYLSVFLTFDRALSDPRTDGDSQTVYFERAETYALRVVQGSEATIGSATPPALDADDILLCDVVLINGQTQILNADIDTSRTEYTFALSAGALSVSAKTTKEMGQDLLTIVSGISSAAADVDYAGGGAWHDTTTNPATSIEAQIDKIISDLSGETSGAGNGGGDMIGVKGTSGSPTSLVGGSVFDQIVALLTAVNDRGSKSNANTWTTNTNTWQGLNAMSRSGDTPAIWTVDVSITNRKLVMELGNHTQKLRVYYGALEEFEITINAEWTGTQWERDSAGTATMFSLERQALKTYSAVSTAGVITWIERAHFLMPAATYPALELPGTNIPYNTSTGANRMYAAQIPKAWCWVDIENGPVVNAVEGCNVSSVSISTSTRPRINFGTDMADTNYAVTGSIDHPNSFLTVSGRNVGYVDIEFWDAENVGTLDFATYLKDFSVVIHGKQ